MPVIICPQCGANWRVPLGAGLHVVAKCLKCGHRFELETEVTRESARRAAPGEPESAPHSGIAPTIWLERSSQEADASQPLDETGHVRARHVGAAPELRVPRAVKIVAWALLFIAVVALYMFLVGRFKP